MFVRRLPKPGLCPRDAKRAPRRSACPQAVSRVSDAAFVSDNAGVDSERNGTPSTVGGVAGSSPAPTGVSEGPPPSDPAPRRCLPARRPERTTGGGRSLPRGVRSRIRRGRTVATRMAEMRIAPTRNRQST